jgi:Tfp pilus assembly protein PilF
MAKKIKDQHPATAVLPIAAPAAIKAPAPFYLDFRFQAILLAIVGFVFYANTFTHEFAFDDTMAIVDNEYVQQGMGGISDILTKDAYQSYLEQKKGSNQLAGGRYRPLSLVTFAIEQQFMGTDHASETTNEKEVRVAHEMHARHFINVLLYVLSVIVLLFFLRRVVFPSNPLLAFIALLLFTIHPVHTEVVANVKSRDEILSLLFISLTFIQAFRYRSSKKLSHLVLALVCYFLALLSKEYGITLILLLPLSFYLFSGGTPLDSLKSARPYLIPAGLYLLMRFSSVTSMAEGAESNVMNNPYLFASGLQKLASEILVLLHYLQLLIVPHPLVVDYSYNQLPYTDFSNPLVWLSLAIYGGMITAMVLLYKRRHTLCFAIAFYLFNLVLVSNFFFNIGAPMGERLIYHSSFGFCMIVGYLLYHGTLKLGSLPVSRGALAALMLVLVVLCGFTTIARNKDWKNDETLFLTDVQKSPNSVLVNNNAAAACMNYAKHDSNLAERRQWFTRAISYFDKSIAVYPQHYIAYLNRGLCYFDMGEQDKAIPDWDTVKKYSPDLEAVNKYFTVAGKYYVGRGIQYGRNNQLDSAIIAFKKSTDAAPSSPDGWIFLGKTYYLNKNYPEAKAALEKAHKLAPANTELNGMLQEMKPAPAQ